MRMTKKLALLAVLWGIASVSAQAQTPVPTEGSEPATVWFEGDYLLWFMNRGPASTPLVTSSTSPNINTSTGLIGQSGTVVDFGEGGLSNKGMSGFRIRGGYEPDWFLPMEFSFFRVDQATTNFAASSDANGSPVLARPIFATQAGLNSEVEFVSSFPGLATGNIMVRSSSLLYGEEFQFVGHLYSDETVRVDILGGYRGMQFSENLSITSSATGQSSQFALFFDGSDFGQGFTTVVNDTFHTRNNFNGGSVACRADFNLSGPLTGASLDIRGSLAAGANEEVVDITGTSTLKAPTGQSLTLPGGILAVPSNSGHFTHQNFALIPEGSLTLGYDLNKYTHFTLGYNYMYWAQVVRPGSYLNRNVDTRQVLTDLNYNPNVTGTSPVFQIQQKDLWVQGISLGLGFSF